MAAIGLTAPLAWGQSSAPATRSSSPATQPAAHAEQEPAFTPTFITVHVKDARPADVLKKISDQAHVHVTGWPDIFWNGQQPGVIPNVTLDLDHVTFWSAIEAVCKVTHARPQFIGQPTDISLLMGNSGTWDQEGPFAFIPMSINHSSQVALTTGTQLRDDSLTIGVFIDPKVHVVHWEPPRLTVAEDEHGLSMVSTGRADNPQPVWGYQPPWMINASIPLTFPPGRGATLTRVEGTMVFQPADAVQNLQIADLSASVGKSTTTAGQSATIVSCNFDDNAKVTLNLRISRAAHAGAADLQQEMKNARIIDAAGQQLLPSGTGTASDQQFDWSGTFIGKKPAKAPFSLQLPIAIPRPPVKVTFKFKDVPLPP